jgi:hypothetical protein
MGVEMQVKTQRPASERGIGCMLEVQMFRSALRRLPVALFHWFRC